jgi:hypothetical protein
MGVRQYRTKASKTRQLRAERDEAALNNKKLRADLAGTHEAFTQQVKLKRVAIRGRAKSESERDTAIERAEKAEGEQDKLLALLSLDQKNEGWPRMVAELRARVADPRRGGGVMTLFWLLVVVCGAFSLFFLIGILWYEFGPMPLDGERD